MLGEGARRLARGHRPTLGEVLLTAANANRLADGLAHMRGAAMKVGQLLSMDSGELLPPQLSEVLARLRDRAHAMPLGQVGRVLRSAWGDDWQRQFERFSFTPLAAASIGQVHEAWLKDGRHVAVKVQYPGVRDSIDSDVANVTGLLQLFRLLPEAMDVTSLLDEARRQLHAEADYRAEALALGRFSRLLAADSRFDVPHVIGELSTIDVLTMQYQDGEPIEALCVQPRSVRDHTAAALSELALREVFDWGLVQTDPNFANYLFDPRRGRIQLLDFGATREYGPERRLVLRSLLAAALGGNDRRITEAAAAAGYLAEDDPPGYRGGVIRLLRMVTEPARVAQPYSFGRSDLAQRMADVLVTMRVEIGFPKMPPADLLFLHRKLGGLYLLLCRIGASVAVRDLLEPYLASTAPPATDNLATNGSI